MKKGYRLLLFLSLIVLISGCKSSKNLITSGGAAENKAHEQLFEDILDAETSYKTISGKVSLELLGAGSYSGMKIGSQLKIVRDDIIQLSLRAPLINTEVFRLDITPDSVYVLDRLGKRYAVESLKELETERNIEFNYYNLQSLFTNALFVPGKEQLKTKDYTNYKISLDSGVYSLQTKDKLGMMYDFSVDSSDRIIATKVTSNKEKGYALNWGYSNFIKDAEYIYPTNMAIKVEAGKAHLNLSLAYSSLDIDKEIRVDRSLPSKYKRVSVMEIIKSYIK